MPKRFKFQPTKDIDHSGQTNGKRANRALRAVMAWLGEDHPDDTIEAHIQDLLCDLHHLCDREKLDIDDILDSAKRCHGDER